MSEEPSTKRPVGRPKGTVKTGGRKPGAVNRLPEELRRFINQRGRPLELLAAIADGRKVSVADPENPDAKIRVYPSLNERVAAARTLLNKVMPDLKSTEVSGPDGGPITVAPEPMNNFDLARSIAFVLAQGVEAVQDSAPLRSATSGVANFAIPAPIIDVSAKLAPTPEPQQVGDYEISFAERLPGDRERWAIRDGAGRLVGTAFGREAAALKARNLESEGTK